MVRELIRKRAEQLDCVKVVAALTDVEAIRLMQRIEGNTPCFAESAPLKPRSEGDPVHCAINDCCWKADCDVERALRYTTPLVRADALISHDYSPVFGGEVY